MLIKLIKICSVLAVSRSMLPCQHKNMMSDEESNVKIISLELSTLKNVMCNTITSFYKKSDGISDDVKKFHTGMNNKMSDIH